MRVDWCERERDFCLVCVVVVSYQEYSLTHTLARSPIPTIRRYLAHDSEMFDRHRQTHRTSPTAHATTPLLPPPSKRRISVRGVFSFPRDVHPAAPPLARPRRRLHRRPLSRHAAARQPPRPPHTEPSRCSSTPRLRWRPCGKRRRRREGRRRRRGGRVRPRARRSERANSWRVLGIFEKKQRSKCFS